MHLQMRTISYEISEMVITGNIIKHRGIYLARAIWFVFNKLLKIPFFNSRFLKEILERLPLAYQ